MNKKLKKLRVTYNERDRKEIADCIKHNSTHRDEFVEHIEIRLPADFETIKINIDAGVISIYYGI